MQAAAQVFRARGAAPGRNIGAPAVKAVSWKGAAPLSAPSLRTGISLPAPIPALGPGVRPAPAPAPESAGALEILEGAGPQVQDLLQASAKSASGAEDLSRGAARLFEFSPKLPGSDDPAGAEDGTVGGNPNLEPSRETPEAKTSPIERLLLSGRAQAGPPSRARRVWSQVARWTGAYALWTVYRDGVLTSKYAAQLTDKNLPVARRAVAARLLAAVGRVDAIQALGFSAAHDAEPSVRRAAEEGILSVAAKSQERLLKDLKGSRLSGRRENAARALGWIARFSSEPAVIGALADAAWLDRKEDVRMTAIEGLSTARAPEALIALNSLRGRETTPHGHSALEVAYAKAQRAQTARTGPSLAHEPHEPPAGEFEAGKQPLYNTALKRVLAVGVMFLAVEFIGSMLTGSLSLKADAMHMAADLSITAGALFSGWMARRPPSSRKTFGYLKIEAVTGLLSSLAIAGMGAHMLLEAVPRLWAPVAVPGLTTIFLALAGLASNAISSWILYRYRDESLSLKGAFLHSFIDAIGSIGIIAAGLLMIYGGWFIADPLISFVIVGLIFHTTWDLAKRSWNVLIDAVPEGLDRDALEGDLLALEGVAGVHHLHVWSLNSTETIATATLHLQPGTDADRALKAAQSVLREKYKIRRATVQIEFLGK